MSANLELLKEVKEMSTKIRSGIPESGNAYLMGYMWASFTTKQQNEIAKSFREQLAEVSEL
jgi:hypothetical protein